MSKRHLRQDNICQNCGETVEKRFCANCGQENTETRSSFGHLLRHFVEDLTHYDNSFWLTMKYLLFRPAYLTKQNLSGRRITFLPPVRLYIFISFITFFLPYVLPDFGNRATGSSRTFVIAGDTLAGPRTAQFDMANRTVSLPKIAGSLRELDSLEASKPESKRMDSFNYWQAKQTVALRKYDKYELGEKFFGSFFYNFPKALFIYLPLFALVLWLFHGKKRWWYFDHAIFTLHYFSFLLLIFNALTILRAIPFFGDLLITVRAITLLVLIVAAFVYFFVAHKRMYGESKTISFLKSLFIYQISLILFSGILLVLGFISFFSIH